MAERMKNPAMIYRVLNRRGLGLATQSHVLFSRFVYTAAAAQGVRMPAQWAFGRVATASSSLSRLGPARTAGATSWRRAEAWSGQAAPNTRSGTPRSSTRRRPEPT